MKWLRMIPLALTSLALLPACVLETAPDESPEDVLSEEEDTDEARSPLVLYGNYCDEVMCVTYKLECDSNNHCTMTILEIKPKKQAN